MGRYSQNIPLSIAKTLVVNKSHKAFSNSLNDYWMSYDDIMYLHYGLSGLDGEIKLNAKGKLYHKKNKKDFG